MYLDEYFCNFFMLFYADDIAQFSALVFETNISDKYIRKVLPNIRNASQC